jgi:hypothetical protein
LKYLTLAVALAAASPAQATMTMFKNGNALLADCLGDNPLFCYGYVEAVADAMKLFGQWQRPECPPIDVTAGQVRDVVVNFLQAHLADRHYSRKCTQECLGLRVMVA